MDGEAFTATQIGIRVVRCEACSEVHVWEKADATFQPGDGPAPTEEDNGQP